MAFGISGSSKTLGISINGTSLLEVLWIGAHTHTLRDRLHKMEYPSSEDLRAIGIFDISLTTPAKDSNLERLKEDQDPKSLIDLELKDNIQGI